MEKKFVAGSEEERGKGLVYARIDGIMRGEDFVLMEIEAIEPHLWLEADNCEKWMEELRKVFLQAGRWELLKLDRGWRCFSARLLSWGVRGV